jgi:hypothetical protein
MYIIIHAHTQNIFNSSTRSHASEVETRTRNSSKIIYTFPQTSLGIPNFAVPAWEGHVQSSQIPEHLIHNV